MVQMVRVYPPAGQVAATAAALDTAAASANTPYAVTYNPDEGGSFLVTQAVAAAAVLPGGASQGLIGRSLVALPTAASVSPTSGTVAASVVITTTGATPATKVLIAGVLVTPSAVAGDGSSVTFPVPNLRTGATTVAIVTEGGTSTPGVAFTVT